MRAALLALLVLAGCKTPEPPDSFGVDLTVSIDAASRAGLAQVLINVSGAEEYLASLPASVFPDGTGKIHYVPGTHTGVISIGATAEDAAGTKLGAGNSGDITIVDGRAVAATLSITPGGNPLGDGGVGDGGGDGGLKTLGTMCGFDNECDSGHCVDGFCCGVASCGQCQNCGSTGACQAVVSKDDNSGSMTCNGQKSCDATGMCKDKWVLLATDTTQSLGNYDCLATGVGNKLFFQGYMKPLLVVDVTAPAMPFPQLPSNPNAFAGYSGPFVTSNGKVYYAGGTFNVLDPAAASPTWTSLTGSTNPHGEAAIGPVGGKIYVTGGRDNNGSNASTKLEIYDIAGNSWTTGPDAPFGLGNTCGGTDGTLFYAFGGDPVIGTSSVTLSYNPTSTMWTQIMSTPPSQINRCYAQLWRNKLAAPSYSSFYTFDLASKTWDTANVQYPSALNSRKCMATAGTPPNIYLMGDATNGVQVWKYNL